SSPQVPYPPEAPSQQEPYPQSCSSSPSPGSGNESTHKPDPASPTLQMPRPPIPFGGLYMYTPSFTPPNTPRSSVFIRVDRSPILLWTRNALVLGEYSRSFNRPRTRGSSFLLKRKAKEGRLR